MENTFLILNNGLTILLLQAKGGSGALLRKKKSFNFFFSFYKRKAQCSLQIFTILDYFSGNYPVC